MIILELTLRDGFRADLLVREIRNIAKAILDESARKWHSDLRLRHFQANSRAIYNYASRSAFYQLDLKSKEGVGKGKTAYLSLSGASERASEFNFRVIATQKKATLRMMMPNYFVRPFVGTITDPDGTTRTITKQPNKVDELLKTTQGDREVLRQTARERFVEELLKKRAEKKTKLLAA